MDPVANLARVLDDARALVATVSTDDLAKPTPCTNWDVGALVQHMIAVCTIYGRAFKGSEGTPPVAQGGTAEPIGGPSAAYRQEADAVLAAARVPGVLDKPAKLLSFELPGQLTIRLLIAEQLLHTWDLAQATGRPFTMDETLAAETLEGMREVLAALPPEVRGEGRAFASEVPCPEDAPAQDRLLAFSGRQP